MVKKRIMMRVADVLGNPELERLSGMNRSKYQTLVKTHGLQEARNKRIPVEVDGEDYGNR